MGKSKSNTLSLSVFGTRKNRRPSDARVMSEAVGLKNGDLLKLNQVDLMGDIEFNFGET
jgi:hypothetical protein